MGNCMWARMGSEGQMWKVVAGVGADPGTLKTKTKNKTCRLRDGGAAAAQTATTRLDEVDVSGGVELQVGDGLGPATAPCRLSSGTAADLFARIAFANGTHTTTTTTTTATATAAAVSVPSVEVLPSAQKGVWKVRLFITAEQLAEILSHQSNTEALIQRMSLTAAAQENNKDQNQNQQALQQLKRKAKIKTKAKAKTKARVLCLFPDSDPGTPELHQQQQQKEQQQKKKKKKKKMEDTHHHHGSACLNRTPTCPWRPSLDSISELPLEDTTSHCEADFAVATVGDDGPDFDHHSGVNGDCTADSSSCAGGVTVKTLSKFLEIDFGQDNNKNN